ncbi:MAG: DUF4234 domain-containing protein [Myxococcota bacterium]
MKGEIRNPTTVWLLVPLTCGLYSYYWWFTVADEIKAYLDLPDLNPAMEIVIAVLTCGLYVFYLPLKYGKLIEAAQRKAGIEARDQGPVFLLLIFVFYFGYARMQAELNRIWEAPEPKDAESGQPGVSLLDPSVGAPAGE